MRGEARGKGRATRAVVASNEHRRHAANSGIATRLGATRSSTAVAAAAIAAAVAAAAVIGAALAMPHGGRRLDGRCKWRD